MKKRNPKRNEVALTALRQGEAGTVSSIRAGHGRGRIFEKRLMDMGPIEIRVRGSRLALGRGMAERIFVEIETK